ncbi:hypothetical protein I6N90_16970 [Paenibacillus sp. GSMTC-2017]|uniref:hypothetical protein n=1 Tax=Paenibacillus sp. GSMTC-2017 TaxID=2794350 RepID=UPI0018D94024|nr:hypothetical protein [Paenibacillus sp. GSMTC-2017]MBH5319490.1 hypothetical protein [Paenibacillus sp. GSMTC-2017]
MREGDLVRLRGDKKVGRVHRIKNRSVEVEWTLNKLMSQGMFKHISEYEIDDLEGV